MAKFFLQLYIGIFFSGIFVFIATVFIIVVTVIMPYEWQSFLDSTETESQRIIQKIENLPNQTPNSLQTKQVSSQDYDITIQTFEQLPLKVQQHFKETKQQDFADDVPDLWIRYYRLAQPHLFLVLTEQGEDDTDITELASIFIAIVLPILLILAILGLLMILMINRIAKPLLVLEKMSQQLGQGELSARMPTHSSEPTHSLMTSFNQMAEKIEQLFQQQQIIIGALPHELRTPLHRIRFALDLTRKQQDLHKLHQRIEQIDTYAEQLEQAVQDILEFSRLQNQSVSDTQTIQIHNLLKSITTEHTIQASINCSQELTIIGNQRLLYRALLNLLSNAQRHKKHSIDIHVTQDQQQTIIHIDDDGSGIPEEHQEQIFTPFFRVDQSRNAKTGGVGLGLALVKLIIEKHGGGITATNNEMGGARLTIKLPV